MVHATRFAFATVAVCALTVTGCSAGSTPAEAPSSTAVVAQADGDGDVVSMQNGPGDSKLSPGDDGGGVYGDPNDATTFWQQQSESDCGLMATRLVVGSITGQPPSEQEMIDLATNTPSDCSPGEPVYDESIDPSDGGVGHGTCTEDLLPLLRNYGINATYTDDDVAGGGGLATGLDALEGYLGSGQKAIVCVNSQIIWDGDGDRTDCGHLVTVAAVDAGNNSVYLGDSGGDDTRGEQVTIDVFESAWAAGGHELVVTN
ncbi:MAG: hypothetical protein AB7G47_06780 [Mycolicibacterium sp.]|uniref:hypothetical protein n=1 Tax=Mycolicibacterium sp. TaxID=2320850 RepID=UPI003D0D8E4C